jgi:hypothetical protein
MKSKRVELAENVARKRKIGNAYTVVGIPEGKRLLGRPRCRWKIILVIV